MPKKLKGGGYQVTNSHSQTFRQQSLSMKLSLVRRSFIIFQVIPKSLWKSLENHWRYFRITLPSFSWPTQSRLGRAKIWIHGVVKYRCRCFYGFWLSERGGRMMTPGDVWVVHHLLKPSLSPPTSKYNPLACLHAPLCPFFTWAAFDCPFLSCSKLCTYNSRSQKLSCFTVALQWNK